MNKKEALDFIKKNVVVSYERVIKETFAYNEETKICVFYTVSKSGLIWCYYIDFKLKYATMKMVLSCELGNPKDISKTVFSK